MKRISKYSAFLLACVLTLHSCTKDFDELNTDPTAYSQANFDPNYLLTTAQLTYTGSTDFSYETWRINLIYCSTMMQQLSTVIGYWAGDKYQLTPWYTSAYWDVAYPEQVKPIVDLVEFTKGKEQYKNLHQIARLTKAMIFQRITDLYGDIPYSEAGLGYYTQKYFPKYDKQQDIYTDLLAEIEDATNKLDPAADRPIGDVIYNGDIAKWQRFGNTLLLRAGMRLSKIDENTAKAIVQKVQGKTMQSNEDNAFLKHDATGGRPTVNRNSQILLGDGDARTYAKWSNTMIDYLKATNDPRLPVISMSKAVFNTTGSVPSLTSASTNPADQKGMPNGYDLANTRNINTAPGYTTMADYSQVNINLIAMDAPTFILTYAESELLLADAAQRWGIGNAAERYASGVRAAFTYLQQYDPAATLTTAQADAYLAANPYSAADGLNMINTQYWVLTASMLDFYEGWSNWRRTGFPVLTPVNYPNNATGGTIPRRLPFPVSEANTNPENYKAAHDAVPGGDLLTGRVWWDKQ